VVDHLERHPGVRVHASQLTGRVLVEFSEHTIEIEDLLAELSALELPDLPEEDKPAHPLDPGPLIQSASRTIGASLGLGVLAARRAFGIQEAPIPGWSTTSAIIGILQGLPLVRNGLRQLLGRDVADVVLSAPGILSLTLSGSPLGLALTAAESVRLLTEVLSRRAAWRQHEHLTQHAPSTKPGATIRLEAGEQTPRAARVIEGTGTAIGQDGLPVAAAPGELIPAGARVYGGPFALELHAGAAYTPEERPAPIAKSLYDHYTRALGPLSLAYAAFTGLTTRSFSRTLTALLLVNPRPALIGLDGADLGASARVLRAGVTVVGTRPERTIRKPSLLLIDEPRVLCDGFEIISVLPLTSAFDSAELLSSAAGIAAAAGTPWGGVFPAAGRAPATDGRFDGWTAAASIGGMIYTLGLAREDDPLPATARLRHQGEYVLVLRSEHAIEPLGLIALRPRLAPGVAELVQTCHQHGVELEVLAVGNPITAQAISHRSHIPLASYDDVVEAIQACQRDGALVAFLSDNAECAAAFAMCDLGIALTAGRNHFPARADLLAPDLGAVASIIEAGAAREVTVRDSVLLSAFSNVVGAVWGFQGGAALETASYGIYAASLAALADGWLRLRGGERPPSLAARIVEARPERWGRRSVTSAMQALQATEQGLTSAQAAERHRIAPTLSRGSTLWSEILAQLRSPLTGILAVGAGLSLMLGSVADVGIIGATIAANVAIGAWQAHKAGRVAEALERMSTPTARTLRDGQEITISAAELVPGDILLLATGDRVAADARVLVAQGLEVDEAALTGESLPVAKYASGSTAASQILLEGSDVTSGSGRAVVVAVGHQTLMGATAAALALEETKESPLGIRLGKLLRQTLPIAAVGGSIVFASGFLRTRQLLPQIAVGASIAMAAVPEGLPLLASMGEAAVARRLSSRQAVVRRLSAVEALGRVDVACTDKTGTLTEGRLTLRLIATLEEEAESDGVLSASLRHVLLTAGLASPHPDAPDAAAHPTDVAVTRGVQAAGMGEEVRAERAAESPFDPVRSFHAAFSQGRLSAKGAPEALAARCSYVLARGKKRRLDEAGRAHLLSVGQRLAERGLRVLLVAEGTAETPVDNPQGLVALGLVGISDPLRPTVREAIQRCHEAGVRVVMITGDHPATARSIAREAGVLDTEGEVLTATELAELQNGELDERLEHARVIARATPLDKVRIVESLQRQGHVVAMTGDGVNDAPALRLADVGVAMGSGGTEVARQTADVVLVNDDFSTLVEALVEGRSFWRNIRRSLGLLLGGNLGEVGVMVGASLLGLAAPLSARQILAVNLVTDVLPGLAVALQQPEHHHLATLAREGTTALDTSLRNDVLRRSAATAGPAVASYLIALGASSLPQARTVAFASVVANQLAQTIDAGLVEGSLTPAVLGAVGGSAGLLAAALTIPSLRSFLGLALPSPLGWVLIGTGTLLAPLLSRLLSAMRFQRPALPHPVLPILLPAQVASSGA
jgi:calcium-translocating P-type ATPase